MSPELETLIAESMTRNLAYLAAITPERRQELEEMTYNPDFLQTLEWHLCSWVTLHLAEFLCARCGGVASEAHHQYYHAGRLALESLQALCHTNLHCSF